MSEAVTPPNPDQGQSVPDPTRLTIDALRREIAMLEELINARIEAAEALTVERFHRLDEDMHNFEDQRLEQKKDTREAVNSALEAQKEATAKMESSMASQISALKSNFDTSIRSIEATVADLKERMTITESVKQGAVEQKIETRQVTSGQIAALGAGIALFMAILALISFLAGSGI